MTECFAEIVWNSKQCSHTRIHHNSGNKMLKIWVNLNSECVFAYKRWLFIKFFLHFEEYVFSIQTSSTPEILQLMHFSLHHHLKSMSHILQAIKFVDRWMHSNTSTKCGCFVMTYKFYSLIIICKTLFREMHLSTYQYFREY